MHNLALLDDKTLLTHTKSLMREERKSHAAFLVHVAEIDRRKLYLPEGYSSLFSFLTKALGLSEASAAKRSQVARLSVRFPVVLVFIEKGELSMTNASLLAPHLTEENHLSLLTRALGKAKREVERLVATDFPLPEAEEKIRALPTPKPVTFPGEGKLEAALPAPSLPPARKEIVKPVSAKRTKFEFTGDDELLCLYETLKARLKKKFPQGKLEDLVKEAFRLLAEKTDPAKEPARKMPARPKRHTRNPSARVRREVFQRDGEQCTFVSKTQVRCDAASHLELDHVIPWSLGGSSLQASNFTVRCRAHNHWRGGASPPQSP